MYDEFRLKLGECFDTEYPTVEQTAEEDKNNPPDKSAKKPDGGGGGSDSGDIGGIGDHDSGYRVWTSSNGEYQVDAKYLGVTEDGQKVKLKRRSDGKELAVSIKSLCKADQRHIARLSKQEE